MPQNTKIKTLVKANAYIWNTGYPADPPREKRTDCAGSYSINLKVYQQQRPTERAKEMLAE